MSILYLTTYAQNTDPGVASITHDTTRVMDIWQALEINQPNPISQTDLQDTITYLVGYTNPDLVPARNGGMQRFLPACHPNYVRTYVEGVNVKGQTVCGTGSIDNATEIGVQTINQNNFGFQRPQNLGPNFYPLYKNYNFEITCSNRRYNVLSDQAIFSTGSTYTDPSGNLKSYIYSQEWLRFVDMTFESMDEYLTQQRSGAKFQTHSGTTPPQGTGFKGSPRILLPNQIVRMLWVGVPARYVTSPNSYLRAFKGRVNQNEWSGPLNPNANLDINNVPAYWSPGELLYVNFKPTFYVPSVAALTLDGVVPGVSYSRLCNIELTFISTRRVGTDLPQVGDPNYPTNANYIVGGHNLLLYFPDRSWRYATFSSTTGTASPTAAPMYLSCPIELLFTDPDFAQPDTII